MTGLSETADGAGGAGGAPITAGQQLAQTAQCSVQCSSPLALRVGRRHVVEGEA